MRRRVGRRRNLARGLALSFQLIAAHRLRTVLSVSGLLAGVATVMVMVAVGRGAEQEVLARLRGMGTNLLIVSAAPARPIVGRPAQVNVHTLLRPDDVDAILEVVPLARAAAPALIERVVARWDGRNMATTLTGTTPEGLRIRNLGASYGRVYTQAEEDDQARVAVVGLTVVRSLFGGVDPVGRTIRVGSVPVEVIGVASPRGVDPGGADLDDVIHVPFATAARRLLNVPYLHAIFVQAGSSEDLPGLEAAVRGMLLQRLGGRSAVNQPFVVQNQAMLLRTERGAAQAMNRLVLGVAGLALLIGGVGILAIMLMSVRERTREIGLRRALGATRGDIALQFLSESAMLATAGGLAGVAVGLLTSTLASAFGPWTLVPSWPAAGAGLLSSVLLGLAVGSIPAVRASRMEPIESLRSR